MVPHSNQRSREPNEREGCGRSQGVGAAPLVARADRSLTHNDHSLTSDLARQCEGVL